ncbi:MAG: hypothetical protein KIT36_22610 [Alphaproteobacteria bacterium]|nr:hypothetical protein [Alphaproteobacteria bacterium]
MARDSGPKIGAIARRGGRLIASCQACGHNTSIDPRTLPGRYLDMSLRDVRFRCSRCGARGNVTAASRSSRTTPPPPNRQRVRELYGLGLYLGALCAHCRPIRNVRFAPGEIARQLGEPDPLVQDAARRLCCPHCAAPLLVSVGSMQGDRAGRRSG